MRRASLIAVHAWPPPRTVSSRAGSAAPDLAAIEAEAARRLAGLLDNWRKTTPTSRSARLSCATARADAGRLVRLRRSGGHRLGPARLGMGSVTVQALAAASGAGLSRSCVQQVDRYFRVGLKYCLLAIDDDRLTTAFWTRQHECRGDVIHNTDTVLPCHLSWKSTAFQSGGSHGLKVIWPFRTRNPPNPQTIICQVRPRTRCGCPPGCCPGCRRDPRMPPGGSTDGMAGVADLDTHDGVNRGAERGLVQRQRLVVVVVGALDVSLNSSGST